MTRTLIAGFGNVLRGDDGFGVEVIRRLEERAKNGAPLGEARLLEVGIGGLQLAQELLSGYDRVIVVDAVSRGGEPGEVYVLRVEQLDAITEVDMHLAVPSRALAVARALGALPPEAFLVGCEPAEVEELSMGLSQPVQRGVEIAMHRIDELMRQGSAGARPGAA